MEDASSIRGKYIRVSSTDIDRISLIRTALNSKHRVISYRKSPKHKTQYLLRIGSHILYDRLLELGMTPNKSLTMAFPAVPQRYFSYFVLGYFDGDGCVSLEATNTARPRRLKAIFTRGSKKFLVELQKRLTNTTKIIGGGLYVHGSAKSTSQLRYGARDSIRLFTLMYKDRISVSLALERKYAIFMTYFNKLGLTKADFPTLLKEKGPVAK